MEIKKEWKYFTIFNHEKEEEYLRNQHRAGWKFLKVTGISFYHFEKCHPDDVFDVDRGKRIALAKAENKTYEMSLKYLKQYEEELLFFLKAIENFMEKSNRQCKHNLDFIETLTNENHPNYKKELPVLISGETTYVS